MIVSASGLSLREYLLQEISDVNRIVAKLEMERDGIRQQIAQAEQRIAAAHPQAVSDRDLLDAQLQRLDQRMIVLTKRQTLLCTCGCVFLPISGCGLILLRLAAQAQLNSPASGACFKSTCALRCQLVLFVACI